MHPNSILLMKDFLSFFDENKPLKLLDIGSLQVGSDPTYRQLIPESWEYTGLDITPGQNVDIISDHAYSYPFSRNTFDILISGQCLEHVEIPLLWMGELHRILKPFGSVCIIAPSAGKIHHRPDYWRIQPDGMYSLLSQCGFKNIKIVRCSNKRWRDVIGTATK